ncbi:MAG: adenylate/guanylate cyclase domain-containing protein [Bacteriovoracaceae bacterium]|nr:adenylate/guanylate cyclase domain-containing protein [Bacteriovoracaceae bacterium]
MNSKYVSSSIRYLGVFAIFLFCGLSMFFSFIERDIPDERIKNLLSYASFFENGFYDFRVQKEIKKHLPVENIVLVKIDDPTIQAIGTWPFPRTVYSRFLDRLKEFGAKVAVFDIIFPEKALSCNDGSLSPDTIFAQAIVNFQADPDKKVILTYSLADNTEQGFKEMPEDLYNFIMDTQQSGEAGLVEELVSHETYPIKELVDAGPALGHLNHQEDSDGVFRHYRAVSNVGSLYLPSLGVIAYQHYTGNIPKLSIHSDGTASLKAGAKDVPINARGEAKIRYHGGEDKFPSVSLIDLIKENPDREKMTLALKDKLIFLGSTAVGAHDLRNTPVDAKLPGVYFHMNFVHMLDVGFYYQEINDSIQYSLIILILGTIFLLFLQKFDYPILELAGVLFAVGGAYYLDQHYFTPNGYEIRLFFSMNSFVLQYVWSTFLSFYQSNKDKKQIRGAFSRYVAPTVVNEMLKDPDKLKVGGQKLDITCMFSDVRDFTTISEALTAEQLSTCLNRYMGRMTELVFKHSGTLDKYIGDAVVALWGAPVPFPNHPQKAVEAAVEMINIMPEINDDFRKNNFPEFKVGIGLNSGECAVGNMGSELIFSFTALGDNMNLGARLEGMCKPYGSKIVISEYTFGRIDHDVFTCRVLDKVRVKGKTKPVEIYEVFDAHHPYLKDLDSYHRYHEAYRMFHQKKFKEALAIFEKLNLKYGDVPTERLKTYCEEFIASPPGADWDGVITFKTK